MSKNCIATFASRDISYRIRHAARHDAPFVYGLFAICADPKKFQSPLPTERLMAFDSEVARYVDENADHDQTLYFIIEDVEQRPVGLISNRRNSRTKEELVGMLVSPFFQDRGIGRASLSAFSDYRKECGVPLLEGIIAESNIACLSASLAAGAELKGRRLYRHRSQSVEVCVVEFFRQTMESGYE